MMELIVIVGGQKSSQSCNSRKRKYYTTFRRLLVIYSLLLFRYNTVAFPFNHRTTTTTTALSRGRRHPKISNVPLVQPRSQSRAFNVPLLKTASPFIPSEKETSSSSSSSLDSSSSTTTTTTSTTTTTPAIPLEILSLQESLEAVRVLPRVSENCTEEDPILALPLSHSGTPTFRRLFTHETWEKHTGGSFHERWIRCMLWTTHSEVVRSIYKSVLAVSMYGYVMTWIMKRWFPVFRQTQQQLPLSLAANALSLLLVFRTNNAYRRLEEARELWSRVVLLPREIVATVVAAWDYQPSTSSTSNSFVKNENNSDTTTTASSSSTTTTTTAAAGETSGSGGGGAGGGLSTPVVVAVCRYLAAFVFSLRGALKDDQDDRMDYLDYLLDDPLEVEWISKQRSRPMAIHTQLRRLLYTQMVQGNISSNTHWFLENDLKKLADVVSTCERIFTSPIPPTMSRHGMRSTTLFFLTMPVVLAVSFKIPSPILCFMWTAIIAFIYLGIDELGVQVEQPFKIIPSWELCQVVQSDIEELVLHHYDEDYPPAKG